MPRRALPLALCLVLLTLIGPSPAGSPPWRVGPFLQSPTPESIWIVWEDASPHATPVAWGETAALEGAPQEAETLPPHPRSKERRYLHRVRLTGLTPDRRYRYRVEVNGEPEQHSFRTPSTDPESSLRFAVLSDSQWHPKIHRHLAERGIAPWATGDGKRPPEDGLSFLMVAGDLVHIGAEYPEYRLKFFDPLASLLPRVPVYPALGNHEYQGLEKGETPIYCHYFRLPDNGSERFPQHWYSFERGNCHFISLNTNLGAEIRYRHHPDMHDAAGAAEQLAWLRGDLDAALKRPQVDFVFALFHHPDGAETWSVGREPYVREIVDLLGRQLARHGKAGAVFTGHSHAYSRGQSLEAPLYQVTVASAGGRLDRWGDYENEDFPHIQKSFPSFGFVTVEVEGGEHPGFEVVRHSVGSDPKHPGEPVVQDRFGIRLDDAPPRRPELAGIEDGVAVASPFEDPDGDAHLESHWQVLEQGEVVESAWIRYENWYRGRDTQEGVDLTRWDVPREYEDPRYRIRVRYRDDSLGWSPWSR